MRFLASIDARCIRIEEVNLTSGRATVDGQPVQFDFRPLRPGIYSLILDHRVYTVRMTPGQQGTSVAVGSWETFVRVEDERSALLRKLAKAEDQRGPLEIRAPMPGLLVKVLVTSGQMVKKGERLLVIEAMKMENEVRSPADGEILAVLAREREVLEKDARLIQLNRAGNG